VADQTHKTWVLSAGLGLAVLSFINLFSYLDRYIVSALIESLKHANMGLSDANLGSLMSAFLVVYTLTAPVFGALGDRRSRPRLIALGVACWSFATALSGFAVGYLSLLAARASVGIGEAAYVTIAPSLLSDYFPARQRGRVMAIFFCAIPVGSALGFVVGGLVDKYYGWRMAFFVAGVPGLLLAVLCLWLLDPPRGAQDAPAADVPEAAPDPPHGAQDAAAADVPEAKRDPPQGAQDAAAADVPEAARDPPQGAQDAAGVRQAARQVSRDPPRGAPDAVTGVRRAARATYAGLLHNKPYVLIVLGYAAYTFAVGGLAVWMPAFLERSRGISRSEATVSFGAIVVITGFIGTFVGGWLGDYCARYSKQAHLWLSAVATLIAAPFVWVALSTSSHTSYLVCMVIGQLLLFLSTGPINAAIVNIVAPTARATALAFEVFVIHILGDALSPPLIGALSDHSSLAQAVKIVPFAVLVGGSIWLWAALTKPRALSE